MSCDVFPFNFDSSIHLVSKIESGEVLLRHREIVSEAKCEQGRLLFPDQRWSSAFLGSGEEKAVYCVCDENRRVFALEVLDERHYLNGRLVGGEYFGDVRAGGLAGTNFLGLVFTGRVRLREFVYGYEWRRFQYVPHQESWRDELLTSWLRSFLTSQFHAHQVRYKDVHERNVMFEIREWKAEGIPVLAGNWQNKLRWSKIGLRPIDVR